MRLFQCSPYFRCEWSEQPGHSKGSWLLSIFADMVRKGKFFSFSFFSWTQKALVSLHIPGTFLTDRCSGPKNRWESSWKSITRAGTAEPHIALHPGMGPAWGRVKVLNPHLCIWGFLPLKIALRNIIDRKEKEKKTLDCCFCHVCSGHLSGSYLREEGFDFA